MPLEETLDATDAKILEILTKNSRTNLNEIAKECGLTSSAVLTRIKKLKDNGTIVGTRLNVREGALGYPYQATVGVTAEIPQIQRVAEEVRKQPNVIVCTKSIGKYNMIGLVIAESMEQLDRATRKIRNIPGVKGIAINIIIERAYNKYANNPKKEALKNDKQELDEVDLAIIKELMVDSRLPFTKIAKKTNVSHETIRKKFERLRANDTITGCSITIDYSKLGYQGTVFIFITSTQGSEKSMVINELKKLPAIFMINSVMGAFDIVAMAPFKNLRDFTKLLDEIQQIPSVGQIEVCLANFTYFSFTPIPRTPIKCDTLELSGSPMTDRSE